MKYADLIAQVAEAAGVTKDAAKAAVEATCSAIVTEASKGGDVALPGFGKFSVSQRAARQGRNPATGATIEIAESRSLKFSPAKAVRETLNAD